MNKTIKLAVAGAVLAMGASAANAGIVIPAGDWTVDINGNVNAFYIHNSSDKETQINGGLANATAAGTSEGRSSINTGLLPSWLGISGKTRANDLDVGFTISFQPGASSNNALSGGGGEEHRQAFLTFGDKSWGTIKLGKDLGIYGSDAILSDMTLLGVGSQGLVGTGGGTTTTLGRIGTGYMYADWKGQISYASPNWNGFSFNAGIMHPWAATGSNPTTTAVSGTSTNTNKGVGFEGKVSYDWAGDFAGKIWVGGIYQRVDDTNGAIHDDFTANGWEIGGKVGAGGFEVVGYYYDGNGIGTTGFLRDAIDTDGKKRDSDGGYIQATYAIPGAGTKIGASWGVSNLDRTQTDKANAVNLVESNEMWTVGVYHPLTKNLNLVAEYSNVQSEAMDRALKDNESDIIAVGAILFF